MVGLLTLDSRMYNYGGFLQEMALQDAIKSLGYECEIIDYDVSQEFNTFSLKRGIKNFSFEKIKKKLIKEKTIPLSDYVSDLVEKRKNVFDEYRADNLVLSRKMSSSDLSSVDLPYEQIVCGSDQIWNPDYNIPAFFLNFGRKGCRRVIYAAKVGRIQAIILGLILSGFVFLGIPFVKIWAGSEYVDSYTVALLLIAPVTVPLIQNLGIEIQRAKNMHKARAIVYLFIALANVALSIPLIKVMGPAGAALGTAISLIAGNIFFMNWYYHARIGMNMFYFWKEIAKFMPALIAPCMLGIIIMNFANITGLIKLGVFAIIYTIVYGLSMYFLGMNEEEKQLVMEPVRKIIKK